MASALHVELNHTGTLNFAMEQAGVPIVLGAYVRNDGTDSIDETILTIEIEPGLGPPVGIPVARLAAGESRELGAIDIRHTPGRLRGVTEAERARVVWRVKRGEETLASGDGRIVVLAFNEWAGMRAAPALLATFVTPNHPLIAGVLRKVRDRLHATTGDNALSAYQKRSPARVEATVRALYETIQGLGISYIVAPASFEETGQKVRLVDAIMTERLGNCLDLSLLVAACLDQMGLHAIVVLVKAHAFPGVWLLEERFPNASCTTRRAFARGLLSVSSSSLTRARWWRRTVSRSTTPDARRPTP